MASPNKIQNKPYRNWVKGALGLCYLQEGLHPFTDRVVKAEHTRILQNLTPCSSCTIKNVLPHHAKGKTCIHKSKAKCNCRQKTNKACNTCGNIYDEIILQHNYRDPIWVTDCSSWYTDHWQFAKCFLTTANQGSSNTAAETDAAGLLSIIINGLFFQTEIQCNIDPPNDVFSQVRAFRNDILHDANLEMTDNKVTRYLTAMVTVLQDKKTLTNDPSAQTAVKKLKKIINDDLVITTTEENKAVQIALDAITKAKEQAEDSIKELVDAKTAELLGKIQSSVSTEFDNKYEPELKKLKLSQDDHENRLKAVEGEQREIKERLLQLENQVSSLKLAEEKHTTRIVFLKQKQDLQKYLVNQYQTHNVKTWVSPLMTQYNNVNIEDVYVPPDLVVEEKDENMVNTADDTEKKKSWQTLPKKPRDSGNLTQTKERHLSRYRDLFNTNDTKNKNIYVIGDVGTGKSSYCKMMIRDWCISVTSGEGNLENQSGLADDQNYQDMNEFEFLFYIPLRNMTAKSDILGMIKAQYLDYETLLDEIFLQDSASCLILLDGLDEWSSPKKNEMVLQHDSHRIPASHYMRNATIITTSRPSARGVLDMKSSECDLRVMLLGIREESFELMIEKYMRLIVDNESIFDKVRDCTDKLSDVECEHLHQTPMLLQQMIWMYCHGYEIGKSITYNYVNIVNMLFAWLHDKIKKEFTLDKNSQIKDFQLPKIFEKYARCQENRKLIILLGKVAYDTFVTEEGIAVVFGRSKLKQLGLSNDDISVVLKYGIFVEENSYDPTTEKSQISFIHTSFLEFFTAVFIASSYDSNVTSSQPIDDVLEKLISHQLSTAGVLRLKNVLSMICGLTPFLTKRIFDCIYQAKERGVIMQKEDDLWDDCDITDHINFMCVQCLSECVYNEQLTSSKGQTSFQVKLHDIVVYNKTELEKYLSKVIPTCVQTFDLSNMELSHEQCLSLFSFLSQAVSLRKLRVSGVSCTKADCKGHIIDISNQTQLSILHLRGCDQIYVSGGNNTNLETCEIINCKLPHNQCSSLIKFLSQTVSIETLKIRNVSCTKADCVGHVIELSNHKQLSSLCLYKCNQICVSGGNISSLETCTIAKCKFLQDLWSSLTSFLSQAVSIRKFSMENVSCDKSESVGHLYRSPYDERFSCPFYVKSGNYAHLQSCKLPHDVCSSLSSFLSQVVSFEKLQIKDVACTKADCKGHSIDLSKQTQLSSLCLHGSNHLLAYFSDRHNTHLETFVITNCELPHDQCSSLTKFLCQTVSIKTLKISDVACKKADCESHVIELSNHKQLSSLYLYECNQICVSGGNISTLETCTIAKCEFPHDLWSSLTSFLSKAVSIREFSMENVSCDKSEREGYRPILSDWYLFSPFRARIDPYCVLDSNYVHLETCRINDCELPHDVCSILLSFLSQALIFRILCIVGVACTKADCEGHILDISNHTQLSSLFVNSCNQIYVSGGNNTNLEKCEIIHCKLSHDQCSSLTKFLSQTVSIRMLGLYDVSCTKADCKGHIIDISNQTQLSILHLRGCDQIYVSGGNNTNLETCEIINCKLPHNQCSSLIKFLSQTVSIETLKIRTVSCTKADCVGHVIDLSNHKQLSSLYLYECNQICVSTENISSLETCEIAKCEFLRDLWSSLTLFLSQSVSIRKFSMENVSCDKSESDGHLYHLSNGELMPRKSYDKSVNYAHLESCKLPHDVCSSLSSFLSQAISFEKLQIKGVACTKDDCKGHSIDLSKQTQLSSLYLIGSKHLYVSDRHNTHLETFVITNCKLPHDQCSSLIKFLSQTVSIKTLKIRTVSCTKADCVGHVIDLSNHKQLSVLCLYECNQICVSERNITNIETWDECTFCKSFGHR